MANSLPESWTNFTGKYASIEPFNNVTAPVSTFAGRRGFLKRVHWALQECSSNRPLNSRITALVGFGGTGKSEVARKLVSVYSQTYTKVAWIDATMESTADQSFMQIAALVSLPDCKKFAGKELAQAVYRYIQRNSDGPALFILDNATQLSSSGNTFGIADYLPADGTGNLPIFLITSQTREWATHAYKMVELPELSQEERIQFLQYTFRLSDVELRKDSELGGLIEKLCEQLPGHPQTLTLVASNIPYTPGTSSLETLKDALDAWVQCRGYDQVLELDAGPYVATDYPNSILNNWNSAMKNLDRLGHVSDARLLLGILNYLPGDHFGCRVLQKVHQGVRRGLCIPSSAHSDEEIFEEALRDLHMVCLIHVEGDVRDTDAVVGVQRLIQAMVVRNITAFSQYLYTKSFLQQLWPKFYIYLLV